MGALQGLEIRRSSAALRGGGTGLRKLPVVAKYIDTSTCIGCKACEVACQEWMRSLDVRVKGPGSGRESAVRALQTVGLEVKSIRDVTPIPHNGCRPPKRRRV